jgi:hypothetical protein
MIKWTVLALAFLSFCSSSIANATLPEGYCGQYDREQAQIRQLQQYKRGDLFSDLEDCIHHTAESLAAGTDSADTIARAVNTLCKRKFDEFESTAASLRKKMSALQAQAELQQDWADWEDEAREVVVQTRAAHCPPRPISN